MNSASCTCIKRCFSGAGRNTNQAKQYEMSAPLGMMAQPKLLKVTCDKWKISLHALGYEANVRNP